jgi:hypothetical protein
MKKRGEINGCPACIKDELKLPKKYLLNHDEAGENALMRYVNKLGRYPEVEF